MMTDDPEKAADTKALSKTGAAGKRRKPSRSGQSAKPGPAPKAAASDTVESPATDRFPVVGVGASARGLDAFKSLLRAVRPDSGVAYILIQHLDPDHDSMMVELLSRSTEMQVVQITDGMRVKADCIYMIPPNAFVTIKDQTLFLSPPSEPRGLRMPIDVFFRSLAKECGQDAFGIILSGTGTDGTEGLRAIKEHGGTAIVQDPVTAGYDGMPKSAIATGLVDTICAPEIMPDHIVKAHATVGMQSRPLSVGSLKPNQQDIEAVLSLLKVRLNFDFGHYKKNTLIRRIERRMGLLNVTDFLAYMAILREDSDELKALFQDLLISVTSFFRDPETMQILAENVVPELVKTATEDRPLRVWVPGCATGEEAYSIAILFLEEFRVSATKPNIQIFATDVDLAALNIGRTAVYPDSIAADVPTAHLRRYFIPEGNTYRINKDLREIVVFAAQNLIADPPFSRMDLISCRNLLIYLEPHIQKRIIPLFNFALRNDGYLFLGSSETVGRYADLFQQIGKKIRIYKKALTARQNTLSFPVSSGDGLSGKAFPHGPDQRRSGTLPDALVRTTLLDYFAPAAVLIDPKMMVQYFHGQTQRYLSQPAGEPTQNILDLAAATVRGNLRALINRAIESGHSEVSAGMRLSPEDDQGKRLKITVIPVPGSAEGSLLVTFEDVQIQANMTMPFAGDDMVSEGTVVQQLEYELKAMREDLQSTIEELETSNEELKASNEEVMSMNEELQSTNEELETSKEELQSLNEELNTVNLQLQEKLSELEATNNDFSNLLASTDMATVFLDPDLLIKRFTPATKRLFNVISSDVGRPLTDISVKVEDQKLVADIQGVMETLIPVEREVRAAPEGKGPAEWYWRRVLPYRTRENKIEGTVITYANITDPRQTRERLVKSEAGLAAAQRMAQLGSWSYDVSSGSVTLSEELRRIFDLEPGQPGSDYNSIAAAIDPADRERLKRIGETTLRTGEPCDTEFAIRLESGVTKLIKGLAEAVTDSEGRVLQLRGTVHDITGRGSTQPG